MSETPTGYWSSSTGLRSTSGPSRRSRASLLFGNYLKSLQACRWGEKSPSVPLFRKGEAAGSTGFEIVTSSSGSGVSPVMPRSIRLALSLSGMPSRWRKTSTLCWPRVGDGSRGFCGESASRQGIPAWRYVPVSGWATSSKKALAFSWGFSRTWAELATGAERRGCPRPAASPSPCQPPDRMSIPRPLVPTGRRALSARRGLNIGGQKQGRGGP